MSKTTKTNNIFTSTLKKVFRLIALPEIRGKKRLKEEPEKSIEEDIQKDNNLISKDVNNVVLDNPDKQKCTIEELSNVLEKTADNDNSSSENNEEIQTINKIKFISSELQEFLRNYRIKNKLTQEQFAEILNLNKGSYGNVVTARQNITSTLEEIFRDYFNRDYQQQISAALNSCVLLPNKNNFSLLIYNIRNTENISFEEIAKKLNTTNYTLSSLIWNKGFLTKKTAIALKKLILNTQNLTEEILNSCNEVLFCVLVHEYRIKQFFSIADFAKRLNISYELLLKIEKTVTFVSDEIKDKFNELIISDYGKDFALDFDDITIKANEIKTKTLNNNCFDKIDKMYCKKLLTLQDIRSNLDLGFKYNFDFRAVQEAPKHRFISLELRNFILNYIDSVYQKDFCNSHNFSPSTFGQIMSGSAIVSPIFEQTLINSISKDFYDELQLCLQTCIELPTINIFKIVVLSYVENNHIYIKELARKIDEFPSVVYRLLASKDFIYIKIAKKLKNLIINEPTLSDKYKELCDEVLFCALIHDYRTEEILTIEQCARQLNISYKELMMIEKTIIAAPIEVKKKFIEIISSYGKKNKIALKFSDDFALIFADLAIKINETNVNNDQAIKVDDKEQYTSKSNVNTDQAIKVDDKEQYTSKSNVNTEQAIKVDDKEQYTSKSNVNNEQAIKVDDKEQYISSELNSFLLSYIKNNDIKLKDLAKFTGITVQTLHKILSARTRIPNKFKRKLFDWFPKEYHSQLQQTLNTCIELPSTNNFGIILSSYKKNHNKNNDNEIARILKVESTTLYLALQSRSFISIKTSQKLKELIVSDPKSDDKSKHLCNEVILSALIHEFRIKHKLSLTDFANQLNISYEQLMKIEKTVIVVPDEVKETFIKIVEKAHGKKEADKISKIECDKTPEDFNFNKGVSLLGLCYKQNSQNKADNLQTMKFMSPELKDFIFGYMKSNYLTIKEFAKQSDILITHFYGYLSCGTEITDEFKQKLFNAIPIDLHTELQQKLQSCIEIPQKNNLGIIIQDYMTSNNINLDEVADQLSVSCMHLRKLSTSRSYVSILLAQSLKELVIKAPKSSATTIKLCNEVIFSSLLHDFIKKTKYLSETDFANMLGISYKELLMITKTVLVAPDKVKQKFYSKTKIKPADSK